MAKKNATKKNLPALLAELKVKVPFTPRQNALISDALENGDESAVKDLIEITEDYLQNEKDLVTQFCDDKEKLFSGYGSILEITDENHLKGPKKKKAKGVERREKKQAEKILETLEDL